MGFADFGVIEGFRVRVAGFCGLQRFGARFLLPPAYLLQPGPHTLDVGCVPAGRELGAMLCNQRLKLPLVRKNIFDAL